MNIDGVILSEKAISQLLSMQAEDNSLLRSSIKDLTSIAKMISTEYVSDDVKAKKSLSVIAGVFFLCEQLEALFAIEQEGGLS